jgi:hypothetical protein
MSNQTGRKPTPEQLEEMRQAQAQAQDTFINQNTALPMPQEGNKIPLEGGGYTWVDPQLANKPIPEAPEGRELTMDDMLTDQKTFEYFKKKGAFDSDQPWYEMLYEGGKAMVSDSYDWMSSLGWRAGSNLLIFDWFGDGPLAQASKNIKASARATTLQTIGDIGLNYEQLGQGASRLMDKLVMDEGSHEDNKSSYEFWKGINEIEKRRQTAAAELASSDFLMMGGDPEIRRMIREGEVKPDYKASMGASIWADPLNYISIGAGYKALRGGANTAFNGAESAMLKELQEAYAFQAQLKEVAKVNPSKKVSDTIDVMDGFIGENLDKLNKIAPKRDIALRQLAESLPQGHPLRNQIEEALTGIPLKAKSNITSKLAGGGMIATGKAVEITGSILNLASRLPQETAINLLMRLGVKEQTAMQIAQSSAVQLGMGGTATYGLASTLTDDELLQLSAVTAVIAPQLLRTYGRDVAKMGAELMQPETILPYWKRLASRGSETLTERTIDRTQWFPVKSLAEQITGAGQGKVGQRIASPFTKNPNNKLSIGLKNEPLGSTGSGGLYDLANALDKSKAGRYLELGGRMTDATAKGGAMGGVFGYVAGGGEQDEALYGGIGAGGLLGLGGGGIGGYGRFRGNLSPTDLIQARYGTHQYYTKNLLPAMQKDKFNSLRKDVQIAVATTAMSYPNLQIEYYNGGKSGKGGEQGINKEGVPYIKVNVDSPRAIEPVIKHELSHYIEEIGGTTPFNDMLIGNSILGLKGFFTKLDENGDPIKKRDGSFETTQKFEDLKFDYFSKFDEYEALYLQSVKSAKAHGANEISARDYAKRRVLNKINQLKDNRTGAFIADQQTVREIVSEHGVDFFLNDQRRYRDLREGWVGALMRNIVDMPMVNNRQFLRTTLGKLGATFRADGTLTTPNSLFRETQRIPMVTELIRKYNRQMEGLSAEQMQKKFPVSEAEVIPVDISGADLAKNPELIELIRAGTFLKVDDDGVIRSNKAMTPAEIKRYNKEFSESILEEVNKIDADEGLPEGHIKETKNEKTGEISFAGRFIDNRVIDRLEQKGGWNKAQIDLLRSLNRTLRYNKNETGGTDWLMSYFKATKKGKYVNAKVENQVHIPYGIEITQKGNILIRTISQKQLDRNINKAFRQHKAEVTRLYGADLDKAMDNVHADMHLWSRNHAEGKKGKDGLDSDPQIAEAKANFINSMFGKSSKAHVDANPWLEQLDGGKKSPTPTYRSLRLERIGKANQLTGKIHIDHNKIAKNLMPKPVDLDALLAQNPQMRSTDPNYMPEMSRRDMLKAMLGGTLATMVKGGDAIVPKKIGNKGIKFPIYGKEHLDTLIEDLGGLEQNHYDDNTVGSPAHEDVSRVLSVFEEIRDSGKIPEFVDDFSNSEAMELMTAYENVYEWSDHPDRSKWEPPHEKIYDEILDQQKPQELTMEQALESAEGGTVGDLVNNPFKGASDDIPKIIEDINIATNIFQNAPAFHQFERSWHINTLVKRLLGVADKTSANKRLEKARQEKNQGRISFNENKLNQADEYFYYMKYPLQDLVASLPDIKSQDLKKGMNSARSADPFEPIKDNFQGGQKRPLQDVLQEMANVHDKFYPDNKSNLNEIRGIGEILKDDYGAEIKQEFLDDLFRQSRYMSKDEYKKFKAREQKTLKELFNPEFNDIQDLGGGAKSIKPIDPDKNLMPSAERKPVTFSARPEEMVTLDSENIKNFMPAHKNVRLEDYLDYPIFCLPSDRMGVGTMFVGPEGQKIPIDFDAQGGRGFMYLYENGGWAFSNQDSSSRFLSRVEEIAGGRDHALVGITIMSDINHLNSVFGQMSLAQAYEAVIRSGHVSKEQMRDHLQDVMGRVAGQKYSKDVLSRDKKSIKHKAGAYKLSEDVRKALLSIEDPSTYKQALLDRKINFGVSPVIVEKFQQVGAKIKPDDQKKYNIDVHSVARDVADPELIGQPVGQVVALLKVPVNQKPKKVDFHLSYPWQVKGEAIGFLDQFKALEDLTSEKRVYRPDGTIRYGQPVQSVLPAFDKLNPALYMPNYKPMLDAKVDNISGLVMPKIEQDKFSPQQFKAKLGEVKGAKEMAEDLGLLDYLEGKKSVTKDEIDQYISDNRKSIMLKIENGYGKHEGMQIEGGEYTGYNEILFYLPQSDQYIYPDASGGHWMSDRILMHMRTTKRQLDDGSVSDEYPVSFHIDEMQSDWHQYGRSEGYADPAKIREIYETELGLKKLKKEREEIVTKAMETYRPEIDQFFSDNKSKAYRFIKKITKFSGVDQEPLFNGNFDKIENRLNNFYSFLNAERQKIKKAQGITNNRPLKLKYQDLTNTLELELNPLMDGFTDLKTKVFKGVNNKTTKIDEKISRLESITDKVEQQIENGEFGQSPAPFKNSWQHRAFADAVQMAVEQGHTYLTWTTGKRSAEMANLDNTFHSVEVRYTKKGFLEPDGSNKYSIHALPKDNVGSIKKSLSEEELKDLIGKDYAKEAITRLEKSDKPITANKVELTNILVPHKGRRTLYDTILPSVAKRIAKTLGTRPPTKAKMITREWGVVPQKVGDKARHITQEVWVMELPIGKEKLHELPLYMPSMMPQQNIPQANTNIMNRLQSNNILSPKMSISPSKASQARDLEPENSYFKN